MLGVYKVGLQIPALLPELQGAVRVFTSRGVYHLPAGGPRLFYRPFMALSSNSLHLAVSFHRNRPFIGNQAGAHQAHKLVPVITSLTFGDVIGHDPRAATRIE